MNNLNNYHNTWEKICFADIMSQAKVILCGSRQDLPVLSITMHDGIVEQKDRFKKVIASHDTSKYKVVKNGQLVIAFPIDEGLIYTQDIVDEGIMSPAYNVWDVNYENFDRRFLGLYFHSPFAMAYYKDNLRGTTQRRRAIPKDVLLSMPIPKPSLSRQKEIVSEIDAINDSIALLQKQVKDLDTLAQSLFYDMFGDPITNPKAWPVKNLSEVGQIIAGSTPSTADESNWDGDVNWVTPAELGEQLYYGETVRKLTGKGAKGLTLMPVGTVLLSSRAPIGKLAITTVPMCCNQGFKNIICNNSTNNIFLYYFLFLTMEHVKALGRGATFKEVSKSAISTYKVILPPLSLQQTFSDRITAIEGSKASLKAQITEMQNLLASRMQYWFD